MTAVESRRSPATVRRTVRAWTLRSRVGRVVLAMLAFIAVLLTVVGVAFDKFIVRGDEVIKRWQPAVSASQDLLADLVNQETGIRGYALSGNASFLDPYNEYRGQEIVDVARLRLLVRGHAHLDADITSFERVAEQWRTQIAAPFIQRVREHDPAVAQAVASPAAKTQFDAVRARAANLTADLAAIRRDATEARRHAATIVWVALAVTAALILLAFWLVWRGLRRSVLDPVERLAIQTQQVAEGATQQSIVPFGPPEIAALGADVDAMRARIVDELAAVERSRAELLSRTEELARSNADLEQFAYVASHDLSEPLRKVANFCQLLERQYGDNLDDRAKQYIGFAVDGAKRMQVLINDLLAFSRVGRSTDTFVDVSLGDVLDRALANLEPAVVAAGASVSAVPLPVVHGDATLLVALFQNLIGNAVKYRSAAPPVVRVTCEHEPGQWTISVSDNGIGIEEQYSERIFAIFQRLHLRDEYSGTGIGLALCRKIVEFHGGRIWLATGADPGATLSFTLPDVSRAQPVDLPGEPTEVAVPDGSP